MQDSRRSTAKVAVSVLTIGRNLDRGFRTAKHVEEVFGLPANSVFVLAALDSRNTFHLSIYHRRYKPRV